jgi:hypothetical protein
MRVALDAAIPIFETTYQRLDKAITDIKKNAELSRKVIAVADILLIAISIYQVWRTPTIKDPSGPRPGFFPSFVQIYANGNAAISGISAAALTDVLDSIRKLISIGVLDASIVATMSKISGGTSSPIPELGKIGILQSKMIPKKTKKEIPTRDLSASGELIPGKSALEEFDIDLYGTFSNRPYDKLAGHELLHNLWLEVRAIIIRRGIGSASTKNPAVAVSGPLHTAIGRAQRALGLFNKNKLKSMTAAQNIELNALAMKKAGVPEFIINELKKEALNHAKILGLLTKSVP